MRSSEARELKGIASDVHKGGYEHGPLAEC